VGCKLSASHNAIPFVVAIVLSLRLPSLLFACHSERSEEPPHFVFAVACFLSNQRIVLSTEAEKSASPPRSDGEHCAAESEFRVNLRKKPGVKQMNRSNWSQLLLATAMFFGQRAVSLAQTPVPKVIVLVQSPAETKTDLQIFCLFRSSPVNSLHGSLIEIDKKLHGLLTQLRAPNLFNGDLGETIVLTPPTGTVTAKKILIIGLGDSSSFTPARMYLVGKIALREANRLGIAHPFFAPTILDGGVTTFSTADVAEQVVRGLRDALAAESLLQTKDAAAPVAVADFTFLAGAAHAADAQGGIDRALSLSPHPNK
jgi:hypothetical protein